MPYIEQTKKGRHSWSLRTDLTTSIPYRIVVVGNFSGHPHDSPARSIRVSKDTIQQAPRQLGTRSFLEPINCLEPHTRTLRVDLSIADIKDFTPERLVAAIPELASVGRLRDILDDACEGRITPEQTTERLAPLRGVAPLARVFRVFDGAMAAGQGPASAPSIPDGLDALIDFGGSNSTSSAPRTGALDAILDSLTHNIVARPSDAAHEARRLAQTMLTAQLDEILHAPAFQQLEAAWRGLKFLVERTAGRTPIHIDALDVAKADIAQGLARLLETRDAGNAPQLVLIDYEFANTTADLDLLQSLASSAEAGRFPLLTNASWRFFGLDSLDALAHRESMLGLFDTSVFDKWNSFRQKDVARWVTIAFNRFLLRNEYTATERDAAGYAETITDRSQRLWGNGAWAVAGLIVQSTARCHWPTQITGTGNGRLEDLCVYDSADRRMRLPLEVYLNDTQAEDLAECGILALVCVANRDTAFVLYAPTAHRPRRYGGHMADRNSRMMSTFPYQLLATRIADAVAANRTRLTAHQSPHEIQENLEDFLLRLIGDTGPESAVDVQMMAEPQPPYKLFANLGITMGRSILGGASVELSFLV